TTQEGQVKGKIAYMPPEQINGHPTDRRADVYAAGVVLWETLTGKRLFDAKSQVQMLMRTLGGANERPSTHAPDVPKALDDVTMRALATEPEGRFASA